ncbi:MAG: 16S rRNA (adenine(1518)-N(6)/adenine(1519)-N(6))-dimethyltransferase RsmA [Alphaproteobacteria bacterium]|nr:16S rRNA (adenine(1518)-N(6)/adenine(1519)-N(6))-dimethyltransferase RsmA [Alphaproteobacteria bacterium]
MNEKLLNLPPVAEMMRDAGLEPKKQLGQNFLFDLNLTRKIARSVPGIQGATVVEVGPGPGGLTRALLECGAARVIAIEKDRATGLILKKISNAADGRLEVIYGDALKYFKSEEWRVKSADDLAICSNLPYNIGTELLIQWLHQLHSSLSTLHSMTLMFQREVADRIVARVGDKQYGRLSVLTALVADAKILFNIPNTAFFPAPKVQSAVVQIIPKDKKTIQLSSVEKLTAKLFGQRRKMIRSIMPGVDWSQFGLTGQERAEELPMEKFVELARANVL